MSAKAASALTVKRQEKRRYTTTSMRWRPTISRPGAGAAGLCRKIVRCGAGSVIGGKVIFEYNPQLEEFS